MQSLIALDWWRRRHTSVSNVRQATSVVACIAYKHTRAHGLLVLLTTSFKRPSLQDNQRREMLQRTLPPWLTLSAVFICSTKQRPFSFSWQLFQWRMLTAMFIAPRLVTLRLSYQLSWLLCSRQIPCGSLLFLTVLLRCLVFYKT